MKVIFDSSVWIAAIGSDRGYANQSIFESYRHKNVQIFISTFILDEVTRNLEKKFSFKQSLVLKNREAINSFCDFKIELTTKEIEKIEFIIDLKDRHILALCKKVQADFLVSFDRKHLLPLRRFGKTKILEPKDFISLI